MITDTVIAGLMNASITGAALAFALLAIVIPAVSRIEESLQKMEGDLKSFKRKTLKIRGSLKKAYGIKEHQLNEFFNKLPIIIGKVYAIPLSWIGKLTFFSFILYCASAIGTSYWWMSEGGLKTFIEGASTVVFIIATLCLLISGILTSFIYFNIYKIEN